MITNTTRNKKCIGVIFIHAVDTLKIKRYTCYLCIYGLHLSSDKTKLFLNKNKQVNDNLKHFHVYIIYNIPTSHFVQFLLLLHFHFIYVFIFFFSGKLVSKMEKILEAALNECVYYQPAILCFDDLDVLFSSSKQNSQVEPSVSSYSNRY